MAVYLFITILEKKWKHNKRFFVRNESCLSLSAGCLVCLGGTPDICHTSEAHHSIQLIFHIIHSAKPKYRHKNTNTDTQIQIQTRIQKYKYIYKYKTQLQLQKHRISAPPLQHTIAFRFQHETSTSTPTSLPMTSDRTKSFPYPCHVRICSTILCQLCDGYHRLLIGSYV